MTRYVTTTNSAPGYKHESTLGGAWESTRIIARIGLKPGLWLGVLAVVALFAVVAVS